MFHYCRDVFLGRNIHAEIDDLETGAFQHHPHQVLSDIMQITLDGADDDLANRLYVS